MRYNHSILTSALVISLCTVVSSQGAANTNSIQLANSTTSHTTPTLVVSETINAIKRSKSKTVINSPITIPTIPQHWQLNLGKTDFGFKYGDSKHGIFTGVGTNVHVDRHNPSNSHATIIIDTAQGVIELIDTTAVDNKDFYNKQFSNFGPDWTFINAHTKQSTLFDALWQNKAQLDDEISTQMVFVASKFNFDHTQNGTVTGELTLNDRSYPFTFTVNLEPVNISPHTNEPVINFIATGKIATDVQQYSDLQPDIHGDKSDITDAIIKDLALLINGQLSYVKLY